jgi:predicted nucleic acid-binding protein
LAAIVLADTGFLVALLRWRDAHHGWAEKAARIHALPWRTCEAVLSEAFQLLGSAGRAGLQELLGRRTVIAAFSLAENTRPVLDLMRKYDTRPMSLADACLVRMSEIVADAVVLTTDSDFRVYRRHSRQVVPCILPD